MTTDQRTITGASGKNRRHRTARVLFSLFLVAFVMMTTLLRSSHALEVASVGNSDETTAIAEPSAEPTLSTPEQTPEASETPLASETPDPTAEVTPEPAQTEFSAAIDGATLRLLTAQTEQTDHALAFTRITAQDDADAFARYQAILEQQLTPAQLEHCTVYALRYTANSVEIAPPQSAAKIELTDPATLDLLAFESIRVFCLTGSDSIDTAEILSASACIQDGIVSLSSGACPLAIVICGDATSEITPSPAPDSVENTPEPSAEPTAQPLYEYENGGLYVSGSPAASDVLPEGAALSAERITSENYPERYAKYMEMLQQLYGTEFPIAFYAYDISFHAAGQEVEPVGDVVNVTIRDAVFADGVEEPLVYHVVNEQSAEPVLEEIPAEAATSEGEDQVVFSADSFSVYIVLANGTTLTLADNSGLTYKVIAAAADQFTNTSYYNSNRVLGIAGNFHIVAFDTATLSAHTNGNVLANKVLANSNFGTNGLTDELSYIQNYTQVNGVSASSNTHVLVLGNANTITALDNGNAFGINGVKLDRPKNLWQDQSTASLPFIDLVALKAIDKSLSSSLTGMSDAYTENHLSTTGGSCDLSYLTLTNPDKVGVFHITAAQIAAYNYLGIKGFQSGHDGAMIINVDCTGVTGTITLPECRIYVNGTAVNFAEVTSFVNGRVLFNLVNCTATVNTRLLYASLLAPDATVNIAQNMNGTVIGNKVTISAESHRDDFVGRLNNGMTITGTKVWSDFVTGSPANTSVTLQLYRSTDGGATRTAYSTAVTLNSTTGWSYNWTELPTGSLYTIVETTVMKGTTNVTSNYATTYSTQTGVASGTITVTNQYLYALPETGGTGALGYYLSGAGLLFFAVIIALLKRRAPAKSEIKANN